MISLCYVYFSIGILRLLRATISCAVVGQENARQSSVSALTQYQFFVGQKHFQGAKGRVVGENMLGKMLMELREGDRNVDE